MVRDSCAGCDELHIAGWGDLKGVKDAGITYKEYVWLIKPEDLDETVDGGVIGCPVDYGISNKGLDCLPGIEKCKDCMNQEIPYPVIAEVVRDGDAGFRYKKGEKFKLASCKVGGSVEIYHSKSLTGKYFMHDHLDDFKFYIDKEEKKVQKEFTKADLRDGMMCERADGKKMLWFNGEMRGIDKWCSGTQSNLTNPGREDLSIVRVGYPDFDKYGPISHALNGDFKEVIWERKEEKEISSEEAFAVLKEHYGCDVKIKE